MKNSETESIVYLDFLQYLRVGGLIEAGIEIEEIQEIFQKNAFIEREDIKGLAFSSFISSIIEISKLLYEIDNNEEALVNS